MFVSLNKFMFVFMHVYVYRPGVFECNDHGVRKVLARCLLSTVLHSVSRARVGDYTCSAGEQAPGCWTATPPPGHIQSWHPIQIYLPWERALAAAAKSAALVVAVWGQSARRPRGLRHPPAWMAPASVRMCVYMCVCVFLPLCVCSCSCVYERASVRATGYPQA